MASVKIESIVEEICMPITDKYGLNLIDVEFKREGSNHILRITIDKSEGVDIEDCENVSRELSVKLDEVDPIEQSYTMEVQSPGERVLKKDSEYEFFTGRDVDLKLFQAVDGKKLYSGTLLGLEDGIILIELEDGTVKKFEKSKVSTTRLKIIF